MQRPIKFRAWDKWSNRWIKYEFGAPPVIDFGGYLRKTHPNLSYTELGGTWNGDSSSYVLMQYTGLKDRHGVEIYEGDICEISGANYRYTFEIVWDEQAAGFGFNQVMHGLSDLDFMPDYLDWNEMMIDKIDRVGVISNIYENPELLK